MASVVLCSLIKHANHNPRLKLFNEFDWLMRRQLSIGLQLSFQFRLAIGRRTTPSNLLIKVSTPGESGRIVAHGIVRFSNGNYETRSAKLADLKMQNAELY